MNIVTKVIESSTGTIKIHGLPTGRLAIKKSALSSRNPGMLSTLLSFRDKTFGDWLPVWSWLIEHPEGNFLIDTGLSSDVHQADYFKKLDLVSRYYFEKQMKFEISREEEIDQQLRKINIDVSSITKVLLTHLHIDHTGGLSYFPETPILVNEREWVTKDGSFPGLFPNSTRFEKLKLDTSFEGFGKGRYLTKSKDLIIVETPGHTRGHCSVILKIDENRLIFFAGDMAYNRERLMSKTFSATVKSYKESVESCDMVLDMATKKKVVFLPSHDPENDSRLMNEIEIS